ncbi:hypothetical protein NDI52_30430 [Leptolyngbya sp. PL-A3]|uniref:hypothetical protein n=1 Tax=Leptolyngbya sp. PL-A3 TaxID=2933911 RepID=UPI00329895BF
MTTYTQAIENLIGMIERMFMPDENLMNAAQTIKQCVDAEVGDLQEALLNLQDEASELRRMNRVLVSDLHDAEREVFELKDKLSDLEYEASREAVEPQPRQQAREDHTISHLPVSFW